MAAYDCVKGKSTNGGSITLSVGFEHTQNELRCLAISHVKDEYQWKVVDAGKLTAAGSVYTLAYPFSTAGQPWSLYIWRKTSRTDDVEFTGDRIPIEAIITKLVELSDKADETAHEAERAVRTPECDGDAFLPPKDVRADEIMGFDSEGRPAVGKNVKGVKEVYEARDEAVAAKDAAKESAEAAASSASNAHDSAVKAADSAIEAKDAVSDTYSLISDAQQAVDNATEAANNVSSLIDSATDAAEKATEAATSAEKSAKTITDALATAEAGGLVIDVPEATTLVSGKVKISTDETLAVSETSPALGLIGRNADGQLVVPMASTEQAGVVGIGEDSAIQLDEDGNLTVEFARATTKEYGVIKLGSDTRLEDVDDDLTGNAPVQLTADGNAGVRLASLYQTGVVMLGSRFQAMNQPPYLVGVGCSANAGKVGQLAFNLKEGGALKYTHIPGYDSGENTRYHMYVENSKCGTAKTDDIYKTEYSYSYPGLVCLTDTVIGSSDTVYIRNWSDDEISSAVNGNLVAPTSVAVKTYVDTIVERIDKDIESISGLDLSAYQNHIADTTRHFVPFDIVDEDGDPTQVFYISGEAQTVELTVNRYLQMLIMPEIIAGDTWLTLDADAGTKFVNDGVLKFTVAAINPEQTERSTFISIRFAQGAYPIEVVQQRSIGTTDMSDELLSQDDEIVVETYDAEDSEEG